MPAKQDVHVAFRVPREIVDQIDRYAEKEERSRSAAVRILLSRALRRVNLPTEEAPKAS